MRIILTVTNDISTDQRMQRICNSLANNGYEIMLVGRKLKYDYSSDKYSFATKRLKCFFNSGFLFYAEYNLRLVRYLLFSKFDVVCSIDLDTIIAGAVSSFIKRKKLVYDAHEYFTESPEIIDRPIVKKVWEGIAKSFMPFVDYAYTVNNSLAEILSIRYKKVFAVIRNLPFYIKQRPHDKNERTILYQGVLNKGRGLEAMILAMKSIDFATLRIAGHGDIFSHLVDLVNNEYLEDKVKFLGKLSPDDLKKETESSWLGINILDPSVPNYFYSLSNKFFDYMMAGVPSISMDFPEYKRVNDDIPIAVLLKDIKVQTIVNSLNDIYNDPILYDGLKSNCGIASNKFNWENEEKKLLLFYKEVIL